MPVQCATILISKETIEKQLKYLNEHYPRKGEVWDIAFNGFLFNNNSGWVRAVNELLQIAMQKRDNVALSDLHLKSLLVRVIEEQRLQQSYSAGLQQNDKLQVVKTYIKNNLDKLLKTEDLCRVANCSKSSIYRMFDESCKMTPGAYILQERLLKAKNALLNENVNISEVAFLCGFSTVSYFAKQFKIHNACTPRDFIKKFGGR